MIIVSKIGSHNLIVMEASPDEFGGPKFLEKSRFTENLDFECE